MKVYTYFEEIPGFKDAHWLRNAWEMNWEQKGFEPVIVTDETARKADLHDYYMSVVAEFPTVNPRAYEDACYRRWLTMEGFGGLWVDFDVFNLRLTPSDLPNPVTIDAPIFLLREPIPAAIFATPEQYSFLRRDIMEYIPGEHDVYKGRPHVSDMTILCNHPAAGFIFPICDELGETTPYSKLIHVCEEKARPLGGKRKVVEKLFSLTD